MRFICPDCGKRHEMTPEYTKFNHWCRCVCGGQAYWVDRPPRVVQTAFIKGYTGGYNEGLGVEVRDKKHFKEVCKEKGANPL